jgi:hypothetical protein
MNDIDKKQIWNFLLGALGVAIMIYWHCYRQQPAPQETTFHGDFHGRFVIYPVSGQPSNDSP